MPINPDFVSIVESEDLTPGIPTSNGEFFFVENKELKVASMTEIYGLISGSQSLGTITPSSTIPTEGNIWGFAGEGTYPNAGNLTVSTKTLGILTRVDDVWSKVELRLDFGSVVEIPNGYKDGNYNTTLSEGYIYYNSKCLVADKGSLSGINIVVNNAGDLKIVAIAQSDESILHSETVTLNTGINTVNFTNLLTVNVPFYVAIELISGGAMLSSITPQDSEGTDYWKPSASGTFTSLSYRLGYSINTVVDTIGEKIQSIGILTKTDTTNLQNAINNGKVTLLDKTYLIEDQIEIPSGTTIEGIFGRSKLKAKAGFIGNMLRVENAEDVRLQYFVIEGNKPDYVYSMNGIDSGANIIANLAEAVAGTYKQNENGLSLHYAENIVLDGLVIRNLAGNGLAVNHTGRDYIKGLKASKLFIKDCHTGIFGENEHEFSNYSELMVTLCQIGQTFSSGNLMTTNSIFTRCRIGLLITGGYNHAHGTSGLLEVKHHQIAGIAFDGVSVGHYVPALHMDYAKLLINDSKGISVNGHFGHNCQVEGIGNNGGTNSVNITSVTGMNDLTAGSNVLLTHNVLG